MLPKSQRVKRALFVGVFNTGKSFFAPHITLRVISVAETTSKFSLVVSKAVAKRAVKRNLLRRRGYSAIAKLKKNILPGCVCVFFFKKGAGILSYTTISSEITELLEKARLLKK